MLHRDTGEIGTYEFGANAMTVDGPEFTADRPIAIAFEVRAPDAGATRSAMMPVDGAAQDMGADG